MRVNGVQCVRFGAAAASAPRILMSRIKINNNNNNNNGQRALERQKRPEREK